MILSQRLCTSSTVLTVEGAQARDGVLSLFTDARGDRVRDHGYYVMAMSNGDRIFLHYAGSVSSKSRGSTQGSFALSGGTGHFPAIQGSGTITSYSTTAGEMTVHIEGQYTLPKF
jgi:hypothetical protein